MNDPYPHYAHMRATSPVLFNAALQMWEVYGYHDIQAVLGDPVTFSSDLSALQTLVTMDPPRHTQLRKLIARAFTSKLIAALEPSIRGITDELLDRVAGTGRMDVIADLAFPLPVTVIAELLGLPAADRIRFKQWSVPAIRVAEMELQGQTPDPQLLEAMGELTRYLEALADERRREPREDLISGLVHASVDGERLTLQEITSTCRLLLIAGFETTANLLGNTLNLLLTHADALARVRADAQLLPSAIEEALRYHTPFQFFARKATRDVTVGGQPIRAGQMVLTINASGNRDEAAFPLERTHFTRYYLHTEGRLILDNPARERSATTFRFDPYHPVPTIGGNLSSVGGLLEAGGFDQRCRKETLFADNQLPLSERRDVLVFQTEPLPEPIRHRGEPKLLDDGALGAAEVRREDERRAALQQLAEGGERCPDPQVVGHLAARQGDVVVHPDEHALALDAAQVVEGAEIHHPYSEFPTSSMSSTSRFEYPHSLSYQPMTFTRSSMAIVSRESNVHEAGEPTTSDETMGSSV